MKKLAHACKMRSNNLLHVYTAPQVQKLKGMYIVRKQRPTPYYYHYENT